MKLTDDALKEFIAIYTEEYGEAITIEEAREMGTRLVTLYELLCKPLPSEIEKPRPLSVPPPETPQHRPSS